MPANLAAPTAQQVPSDQESSSDPGRSSKPKSKNPKKREPKFSKGSKVWLKVETAEGEQSYIMIVCDRREKVDKKRTSYEYRLEDNSYEIYENGRWVAETKLESCDGS